MWIFGIIFLLLQTALGYLLTLFLDPESKLSNKEIVFSSVALGLASSSFLLLGCLLLSNSWVFSLMIMWFILAAAGIVVLFRFVRSKISGELSLPRPDFRLLASPAFWLLLIAFLLYSAVELGVFYVDPQGYPFAILIGWADSAFHLNMITHLKVSTPFVLDHHLASGEKLNYPFLINLLTALYQRIGFPLFIAWHLPVYLFGISFLFLLYSFGKRVFKIRSLSVALVFIAFFGSGIGFMWFFQDLSAAWNDGGFKGLSSAMVDPPREYTHLDNRTGGKAKASKVPLNIVWIVPAVSFLSHQRSFVAGISLAVIIFIGFYLYRGNKSMWRWGLVWGMIPLLHAHSFIAVTIVLCVWFCYDFKNWSAWLKAGILGCLLVIPQMLYLVPEKLAGSGGSSFLKPWLWWMTCTHHDKWYACDPNVAGVDSNPLWFWLKNFGFVFVVWLLAILAFFIFRGERKRNYRTEAAPFLIVSIVLFVVPNVMLFQTWEFDNGKILFYWWLFAAVMSIYLVHNLFKNKRVQSIVLIVFTFFAVFSGMIDVLSRTIHFTENHHGYYGPNEIELADWIEQNTQPNDRFLTSTQSTQPITMLTGRGTYLGYTGWLWTKGKQDMITLRTHNAQEFLYTGEMSAICDDRVAYVLWDRDLIGSYPRADKEKVLSSAQIVFSQNLGSSTREIMRINCPKK